MLAMHLLDVVDNKTSYGILMCANGDITEREIQDKVYEIKDCCLKGDDWTIEDIINKFPEEWQVYLQKGNINIMI